jgi:hypothetical protein
MKVFLSVNGFFLLEILQYLVLHLMPLAIYRFRTYLRLHLHSDFDKREN